MKPLAFISIIVLTYSLTSCMEASHDKEIIDSEFINREAKALLQDSEKIEFRHIQSLVLNSNCVSCHNSSRSEAGIDLTSFEKISESRQSVLVPFDPLRSTLYNTLIAKGKRRMPPLKEAQLLESQKTLIHTWISNGGKLKASSVVDRPLTLKEQLQAYFDHPERIDYELVKNHVFERHCNRCHTEGGADTEEDTLIYSADLTSYDTVFSPFNPIVVKGLPAESSIYRAVAIEQTMPPTKDGYDPLDGLLVKLMRLWILNCSIEFYVEGEEDLSPDPDNPDKVRLCDGQ